MDDQPAVEPGKNPAERIAVGILYTGYPVFGSMALMLLFYLYANDKELRKQTSVIVLLSTCTIQIIMCILHFCGGIFTLINSTIGPTVDKLIGAFFISCNDVFYNHILFMAIIRVTIMFACKPLESCLQGLPCIFILVFCWLEAGIELYMYLLPNATFAYSIKDLSWEPSGSLVPRIQEVFLPISITKLCISVTCYTLVLIKIWSIKSSALQVKPRDLSILAQSMAATMMPLTEYCVYYLSLKFGSSSALRILSNMLWMLTATISPYVYFIMNKFVSKHHDIGAKINV